jgi:hypothetical protein
MHSVNKIVTQKRKADEPSTSKESAKIRRLAPTKISEICDRPGPSTSAAESAVNFDIGDDVLDLSLIADDFPDIDLLVPQEVALDLTNNEEASGSNSNNTAKNGHKPAKPVRGEKTEITEIFQTLLDTFREADKSEDMETLINKRIIKNYQLVHPDFVNSKSFIKDVKNTIDEIKKKPSNVYLHIKHILEELIVRRKSTQAVITNEEAINGSVDEKTEKKLKKLNKALWILKKRIQVLEESDIDLSTMDEVNSDYLRVDRYKKRAVQIYEKICDLTGESKNAQRLTKKPIVFKDTHFEKFNQTVQKFVNKAIVKKKNEFPEFPDYYDILRILDHCDKTENYKLGPDTKKKIGEFLLMKFID